MTVTFRDTRSTPARNDGCCCAAAGGGVGCGVVLVLVSPTQAAARPQTPARATARALPATRATPAEAVAMSWPLLHGLDWSAAYRHPGLGRRNRDLLGRNERVGPGVGHQILMGQLGGHLFQSTGQRRCWSKYCRCARPFPWCPGRSRPRDRRTIVHRRSDDDDVQRRARGSQRLEDGHVLTVAHLRPFGRNGDDHRPRRGALGDALTGLDDPVEQVGAAARCGENPLRALDRAAPGRTCTRCCSSAVRRA